MRVISAPLDEPQNMVLSMDRQSAAEVAEHVAKLGHERIAMIIGPQGYRSAIERLGGFSDALEERGLKLRPEYIAQGAYTFESGVECAELLLSRTPRPTAIFAGNDETAAGRLPHRLPARPRSSRRPLGRRLRRQSAGLAAVAPADDHAPAHP